MAVKTPARIPPKMTPTSNKPGSAATNRLKRARMPGKGSVA
jgi:hypothetical protein